MVEDNKFPKDWKILKFKECADIRDGTHDTPQAVQIGYPLVTSKNLKNGSIDFSDTYSISQEDFIHINRRSKVDYGDILYAMIGTIGNPVLIEFQPNFAIKNVALFKPNNKQLGRFLKYYLECSYFTKELEGVQNGSNQNFISLATFRDMDIVLPNKEEQYEISEVLSDIDKLIASLKKLIDKKKAIKRGAMQELLTGKRRLQGFNGEWVDINLAENSRLKARIGWQGLTKAEYLSSGYAYLITGTDFSDGRIDWNTCCFVDRYRFEQDSNIQIRNRDILITKDGTIGKVAIICNLKKAATLNSGVFVIRPLKQENYVSEFVYHILSSFIFEEFLEKLSAGSTISHLNESPNPPAMLGRME